MRVGLNLLHARPAIGGAWNYIARLIRALAETAPDVEFVAYTSRASASLVPRMANFRSVQVNLDPGDQARRVLYENTWLPVQAHRDRLDCMHWFANTQAMVNAVPAAVTVYDLQSLLRFADYSPMKRLYTRTMVKRTARRAALLLPMSQSTAQGLRQVLGVPEARMVVIPPVIGEGFRPQPRDVTDCLRRRYGLPPDFWLYVAHFYRHKNHSALLDAYALLRRRSGSGWPLVLRGDESGTKSQIIEAAEAKGLGSNVMFLPKLDDGELPALYSAASALVFPSLYEGGGIPVLEAMACGCPVLASDIPTSREFAGDAALMFDPTSIGSIAAAMALAQTDDALREQCRERGLARVGRCRPATVCATLLGAYHLAVKQHAA